MKTKITRKRGTKEDRLQKNYQFLLSVNRIFMKEREFSMNDLLIDHNMAKNAHKALRELNLISSRSTGKGNVTSYKWIGGKPSIDMAKSLMDKTSEINMLYSKQKKSKENVSVKTEIQETPSKITRVKQPKPNPETTYVSILWGLVKIKKTK